MRKKDLVQLGITGVLAIVLIFAISNAFKKSQRRSLESVKNVAFKKADAAAINSAKPLPVPESKDLYVLLEQQAKSMELRRDPFTAAPILSANSLQSGVNLTGILWEKAKPLAIIDGEIVKKGERVGPKTVVDIKRDRVILSDGKVFTELKLEQ